MIFIVGHHASGKTRVGAFLQRKFGLTHVETSKIVKQYKLDTHPEMPMSDWIKMINETLPPKFLDMLIASHATALLDSQIKSPPADIAITGNRSLDGVNYLATSLAPHPILTEKSPLVVGIITPAEVLYQRYKDRNRDIGDANITFDEFRGIMLAEERTGLGYLLSNADAVIHNDSGNIEILHDQVTTLFRDRFGYAEVLDAPVTQIEQIRPMSFRERL